MANLIITVISIALVAVAAVMGAYYGGTAFMDGQAKSQANQMIEGSKQIAAAWTLYANNHGGSYALTDGTFATDLVPNYVQSLPRFDFADGCNGAYAIKLLADGTIANLVTDSNFIQYCGVSKKVCEQINLMTNGNTTIPNLNATQMFNASKPFACDDPINNGTYYFRYRVF